MDVDHDHDTAATTITSSGESLPHLGRDIDDDDDDPLNHEDDYDDGDDGTCDDGSIVRA